MAWNDPNQPGRNNQGSEGPPDLDEVFRRLKRAIMRLLQQGSGIPTGPRRATPMGNGSGNGNSQVPEWKKTVWIGALISGLLYAYWGITIIQPGYEGALFRLGRYVHTLQSGQHWVAPFFERVETVNVDQVFSVNVGAHHMLTGDENIVSVEVSVSYRVQNIRDYVMQLVIPNRFADPRLDLMARRMGVLSVQLEKTMEQVTDSALRQVMGASKLDAILTTGRGVTAQNIHRHIQELINKYQIGIKVENVNLQQISAPEEVKDAFDDVMRAREDERTFENQAHSYAKQVVPDAQGQALRLEAEARAYKEQVILKAQGEVAQFLKLEEAYQKSPHLLKQQLYLDTMQSVFSKTQPIFLDTAPGQVIYMGMGDPQKPGAPPVVRMADPTGSPNLSSGSEGGKAP